jgi:hypothetical protein
VPSPQELLQVPTVCIHAYAEGTDEALDSEPMGTLKAGVPGSVCAWTGATTNNIVVAARMDARRMKSNPRWIDPRSPSLNG